MKEWNTKHGHRSPFLDPLTLVLSRRVAGSIFRVSWFLPGLAIASPDGAEVHVFDPTGRHLRTVDSFTNTVLYSFTYGGNGHLLTITDRDGDTTRVERDAAGNPTAIVSPDGQRTELTLRQRK